jgi:hypothetical protein
MNEKATLIKAFQEWRFEHINEQFANQCGALSGRVDGTAELLDRREMEHKLEREIHNISRSDMMVKYFSEKVAPGVHDAAAKKEGFGVWKEQFMHSSFEEQEKERYLERKIHVKTRSDMLVKSAPKWLLH